MKVVSKGTLLQIDIATVFTTIAQVDDISGPEPEVQDVETPTLDQIGAGIPHDPTGFTEPGTLDFDIYWDLALPVHQELTDALTSPHLLDVSNRSLAIRDFKIVCADVAATELPFSAIVKKLSPAFQVGSLVKASVSLQLIDLATYPS